MIRLGPMPYVRASDLHIVLSRHARVTMYEIRPGEWMVLARHPEDVLASTLRDTVESLQKLIGSLPEEDERYLDNFRAGSVREYLSDLTRDIEFALSRS